MYYAKNTPTRSVRPQIGQKVLIRQGSAYASAHVCNIERVGNATRILTDLFGWTRWSTDSTVKVPK